MASLPTASLNFEEFCMVLIQIEPYLNSGPITVLSSDAQTLTPGHF
jgi:hypothetical protein